MFMLAFDSIHTHPGSDNDPATLAKVSQYRHGRDAVKRRHPLVIAFHIFRVSGLSGFRP